MPKGGSPNRKDITFIIGNPRSKQNVSRIRKHASKITKDAAGRSSPSATPTQSIQTPSTESPPKEPKSADANIDVRSSPTQSGQHSPQIRRRLSIAGSVTKSRSSPGNDSPASAQLTLSPRGDSHFTTRGSKGFGTWREILPSSASLATAESSEELHISQIRELHLPEPASQFGGHGNPEDSEKNRFSPSNAYSGNHGEFQSRWHAGHAPSAPLTPSPEDFMLDQCLRLATSYYSAQYEASWQPKLKQDKWILDLSSEIELWEETTHTAAALIEAHRADVAVKVINHHAQSVDSLLLTDHPELFSVLCRVAFGTKESPLGQLRTHLKRLLAVLAQTLFGSGHPITQILKLRTSDSVNDRIQVLMQQRILEVIGELFGANSYQRMVQYYYLVRILEDRGYYDEALAVNAEHMELGAGRYGLNSIMLIFGLIEQASIYLASGQPDVKAELHIHDALRRLSIIGSSYTRARSQPDAPSEQQDMTILIAQCRVAALRLLSRLHRMRGNWDAAMHFCVEALAHGRKVIGVESIPVMLANADLDRLERDPSSPISKERSKNSTTGMLLGSRNEIMTDIGSITYRTNQAQDTLPQYKCTVYGFLLALMFTRFKIPEEQSPMQTEEQVAQNRGPPVGGNMGRRSPSDDLIMSI